MEISVLVSLGYSLWVDVAQPVVGRQGARVVKDEPAERVVDVGILFDPPVRTRKVALHGIADVEQKPLAVAQRCVSLTVQNKPLGQVCVVSFDESHLDAVLNGFDIRGTV
ncbi:unannotated protein [freshwater metagenome]|uniref:Unannotated protein n=1 Tax=freshwater metagenome TaxID=449393 RepID=A0A6J7RYA2_9ZZZZ